ncbi:hypothetical protein [Rubellicoccus peritrichatus]|uniref:PEP-CTERM protein-sorting domain-containing protein n=1 Tax=Rubellicoccus peritrichatus TaxID=3080537 RepID=A0AAQ3LD48_9BACT|nr:hypothetical protein [Puniceicoccus sp. CR14]WOO39814.1 hypothetical protein RZN69_14410 [Puniceicoccus sp. CR14]
MFLKEKKHTQATVTAAVSSLFAASNAQGIIQYFDSSNAFSAGQGGNSSATWNIDGDPFIGEIGLHNIFTGYFVAYSLATNPGQSAGMFTNGGDIANLASGYTIPSNTESFANNKIIVNNSTFVGASGFTSGETGFMGFYFNLGSGPQYGWAEVTFFDGNDPGITVHRWAYEDDGSSIQVGDTGVIPEPATVATGLGALALGAAGLRRWRKAKQAA